MRAHSPRNLYRDPSRTTCHRPQLRHFQSTLPIFWPRIFGRTTRARGNRTRRVRPEVGRVSRVPSTLFFCQGSPFSMKGKLPWGFNGISRFHATSSAARCPERISASWHSGFGFGRNLSPRDIGIPKGFHECLAAFLTWFDVSIFALFSRFHLGLECDHPTGDEVARERHSKKESGASWPNGRAPDDIVRNIHSVSRRSAPTIGNEVFAVKL